VESPLQLVQGEVALANLALTNISLAKKSKEISGGSGSVSFLGFTFGNVKRKYADTYIHNDMEVNRTVVTNKRVYIDTNELMYDFRLKGIVLLEYHEGMTLRMISKDYSKSSVYLTFKTKKDMKLFMRIFYTYLSLGKIYNLEEEEE
jgi:hypothetical protein